MNKLNYMLAASVLIGAVLGCVIGNSIYYHYMHNELGINEIEIYGKCLSLESTTHQQYTICSNGKSFYEAK